MNYTGLVLITTVIVVGTTEAKRATQGKSVDMEPVIAGFFLGLFLFIFGFLNESLATQFAYIAIVAALLTNGAATFQALTPKQ